MTSPRRAVFWLASMTLVLIASAIGALRLGVIPQVEAAALLAPPTLAPLFSQNCTNAWYRYTPSVSLTAYATLNADSANATNSAEWRPSLPAAGYYTVEVYIPLPPSFSTPPCSWIGSVRQNTTQAHYLIQHANGQTTVTIDQQAKAGTWVNLGAYYFAAGTNGFVRLRDLNSEPKFTRFVVFSDARFTPAHSVLYMPLVAQQYFPPNQSLVVIRNQQAFDSCYRPTLSQMQTWWNASPYYIYNLYLGGVSNASCYPETLTASWISAARQQGWVFIPTWVGPQAPCTTFKYRFSQDPLNAFGQGIYEAELAFARAVTLGLTGQVDPTTVIYYDMEAFYGASTECRTAVKSFLSGWAQRLHELGARAGVYGSSCYYMPDWKALSNPLDDAWLASWYKVDHDNNEETEKVYFYDPYANVWSVACSTQLSDAWLNQQRIRQYAGGHNETWGGVTLNIDSNIVNGRVVAPFSAAPAGDALASDALSAPQTSQAFAPAVAPTLAPTVAQPSIADFQLVAPDQGWVLQGERLLWTADGGATWVDRTPMGIFARWLGVHFEDPQRGWALVLDSARDGVSAWQALRTTDGGVTWQASGLPVSAELASLGEAAFFDFVDENQGWLSVRLQSSSAFSLGALFSTQDGGQTWQMLSIPIGAAVHFADALNGWTAGGAAGDELYVSRDGGRSWQSAAFVQAQGAVFYGLPRFSDAAQGTIAVTVADPAQPRLEMYVTRDGGQTWQISGAVPLSAEALPGVMAPLAWADAQTLLAAGGAMERLFRLETEQGLLAPQGTLELPPGVVEMEFSTPLQGWARQVQSACTGSKSDPAQPFSCQVRETLLQTSDGGRSWKPIR